MPGPTVPTMVPHLLVGYDNTIHILVNAIGSNTMVKRSRNSSPSNSLSVFKECMCFLHRQRESVSSISLSFRCGFCVGVSTVMRCLLEAAGMTKECLTC